MTNAWRARAVALAGIVLVALNLRIAVAVASPIADSIGAGIRMTQTHWQMLAVALPLCFAVVGALAPKLARRIGIEATLVKECWEEAGIAEELARKARAGRTVHVLQSLPEGTQAEQIFIYDLALPEDFVPHNQDGEVGEHRLARIDEAARWIEEGAMTVDASLATLDCLLRRQWIDAEACEGIDAIFAPPRM